MLGIPNTFFEELKTKLPICPACLKAYKGSPGLVACYLVQNYPEQKYHIVPAMFIRNKMRPLAYAAISRAALCSSRIAYQCLIYDHGNAGADFFSRCLIYDKGAGADLFSNPAAIFALLSSLPFLEGVPWTVELFQREGIDCELVLHALKQLSV